MGECFDSEAPDTKPATATRTRGRRVPGKHWFCRRSALTGDQDGVRGPPRE
jgi:hypothetical protein